MDHWIVVISELQQFELSCIRLVLEHDQCDLPLQLVFAVDRLHPVQERMHNAGDHGHSF